MTPQETTPKREVVLLADGQGEVIWFLDTLVTTKLSAADGGEYGLIEYRMAEGARTPFHRHQHEDESLYVLEGALRVVLEHRVLHAGPGAYVHLPRGHAHALVADAATRALVLSRPDGFVEFTRALGTPAQTRELPPSNLPMPDMARLLEVAASFGIDILGPPPT